MPGRRVPPEGRRAIAEHLTGKAFSIASAAEWQGRCEEKAPFAVKASDPVWNGWSNDLRNRRFQASAGLSAADLPKLRLRWAFGFEGDVVAFAQPALFGGRIFVGSGGGTVYSIDAKTGCTYWRFEAQSGVRTAVVIGSRGSGKYAAYFGDLHGVLYAVDAASGELLWTKQPELHSLARITGAPALHEGRLYVPMSSFEEGMASHPGYQCCTFRGSVAALDAQTGKLLWQTFMIDRTAVPTSRNSAGTQSHGPSGAAIWSTPTVDTRRQLVYVTTGDNYSSPATPMSDSVVAIKLSTGAIEWSRQLTPDDVWNAACLGDKINCPEEDGPDHDLGASAILAETKGGRELLIAAQKSGMVYALDPNKRGEIVWQSRAAKGGVLGGMQWGHAVDASRVYAPVGDMVLGAPASVGGGLVAMDIATGKVAWRAEPASCDGRSPCSPAQMAAATVIPGVVFSGARDGILRGYSTESGKVLWNVDTAQRYETVNKVEAQGGAIDGPGPVVAGGMLFVNSGYAWWGGRPGNVLLAFSTK